MLVELKYFTEDELTCKCGCGLLNYNADFLLKIGALRSMLGIPFIVNSGCRCLKHNHEVGGQPASLHICECKEASAIDITCSNISKLFTISCRTGMFNEVIKYKKDNFIHLGYDKNQVGNYFEDKHY